MNPKSAQLIWWALAKLRVSLVVPNEVSLGFVEGLPRRLMANQDHHRQWDCSPRALSDSKSFFFLLILFSVYFICGYVPTLGCFECV
jgi:hypothetical protein